jgi:hypothetical protein
MASQNPSTAYTAAPEKKSGSFFSSFPSFSLPKLPDFFGTGAAAAPAPAPAPAPAAPTTAVAEQSSVQPGGRRRRGSKKAGRRRTRGSKKGGIGIPRRFMPGYAIPPPQTPQPAGEAKTAFGPVQVRKGGRRTRRGGLTPAEGVTWKDSDVRYMTQGTKAEFPPTQIRKPTGKGRRTHRVKKHSRR